MNENLRNLKLKDSIKKTNYYIVIRDTIFFHPSGVCPVNINKAPLGTLVQAIGYESKDTLRLKVYQDKITDLTKIIWHDTEWKCNLIDLFPISSLIWRHLITVSSLNERVRLATNEEFRNDVEEIVLGDIVWFCPADTNLNTYKTSVQYIGPVPELGDGFYFGLDILVSVLFFFIYII